MLKVLKNLKESWISVVIIILLLCVQAAIDLELPNYTSKIVNNGIQSGGIENAIPNIISKKDMETILKCSEDDEKILECYNYNEIEERYEINKLSKDKTEELNSLMIKPVIISQNIPDKEAINQLSEEQINTVLHQAIEQIEQMPESIREQAAVAYVKTIYQNAGIDTNKIQMNYIFWAGLKMLGFAALSMTTGITVMILSSRVGAKMSKTLRNKVFNKVMKFSNKELKEFSTASLITRNTNDVQQIQQLLGMLFRTVIYAPIIGIGGIIKVMNQSNSTMAWIIGGSIIAILISVVTLFAVAMPKFKKLQELLDKLNGVAREILTGKSVIRAFNTEEREEKRFDKANTDLMNANLFVNRTMAVMMPILTLIMNVMAVLIIWFGGKNVDKGIMKVGDLLAFIQYSMQIVMSFLMISIISIMLPRASISAKRITEVLETEPSIKDKEKTEKLNPNKKGFVEFKNVSFRYPDADTEILEDINFIAEPGKTTAIIGSTGSGKSTVVNLIPRFYDVTGGEILVDGVNVKDLSQRELRDIIGFVPQRGILFSGTIESNIKYANSNISDEKMIESAEIAQAVEFIHEKEEHYQAEIAQGGNNVSGGQKQRLSIARAIAKDPEIFIFDDSFSALDFKTDAKLREALAKRTKNKTNIIVAQRINTILNADKIIVLEDGKVVGQGTHDELIKNNETYREIALSQLSESELNIEQNKEGGE